MAASPSPLVGIKLGDGFQQAADSTEDSLNFELNAEEVSGAERYDPSRVNIYHLFTR